MRERIVLALKGVCMGIADIIPGVSGGTLALILGIYTQFIDALRSLDLRFVKPLVAAVKAKFAGPERAALIEVLQSMRLGWLMTLGTGIVVAMGIGSKVIPSLMESYPAIMNALFFGLILASVAFPIQMMTSKGSKEALAAVIAAVLAFVLVGAAFTPPLAWEKVTAEEGQTLKEVAEAGPSALKPADIYWHADNQALRESVPAQERNPTDKGAEKAYGDLEVPAGVVVSVPKPAAWFILIAGFIGISAMLLPGVSGSFLLLIFGVYYFMLNALKGFLKSLIHFSWPGTQILYVSLFICGMIGGLLLFSRLLSWLLHRYPNITMASLAGMMLGCLRTIWPFKVRLGADVTQKVNVIPSSSEAGICSTLEGTTQCWSSGTVIGIVIAFIVGIALVFGLAWIAKRKDQDGETPVEA